jgi:pantothenate kinase
LSIFSRTLGTANDGLLRSPGPGSGKSTLAEKLETVLNSKTPGYAAVFPMDGYHFDDQVLIPHGLRPRKGAPETFDVEGFAHMLGRLRSNAIDEIVLPVFDRSLEIARAGARIIPQSVRLVLVEGNYLLQDRDGWKALTFDMTMMLDAPRETLRRRLMKRWVVERGDRSAGRFQRYAECGPGSNIEPSGRLRAALLKSRD